MKTILVLGAGDGSAATLAAANRLGYRTLAMDRLPGAFAGSLADEFLPVSTSDLEAVACAVDGRTDIAGVVAPASDIALPTVLALGRRLGLPHPPAPMVACSVDKTRFHRLRSRLGFPAPTTAEVTSTPAAPSAVAGMRWPLVVKPVDATGSRGITVCPGPADLPGAVGVALAHSPRGRVLVEEWLSGSHHTLEGLLSGGKLDFAAVTTRTLTPPPYLVTTEHRIPSDLDADLRNRVVSMVDEVCRHTGYRDGPIDVDFVVEPDGRIQLIEIGARVGGSGLTELVRQAYGVDVAEASIQVAVGLPVEAPVRPLLPSTLTILHCPSPGRLARIDGLAGSHAIDQLAVLCLTATAGDRVRAYTQAAHKLGYAVLSDERVDEVHRAVRALATTLRFTVLPEPAAIIHGGRRKETT